MKQKHVWVIEMWDDRRKDWLPCAACYLTSSDARKWGLVEFRRRTPDDRFRAMRYVYRPQKLDVLMKHMKGKK